jgi:hypothetical protein
MMVSAAVGSQSKVMGVPSLAVQRSSAVATAVSVSGVVLMVMSLRATASWMVMSGAVSGLLLV